MPEELRAQIHTGNAISILQRFYCPAMKRLSHCSMDCAGCRLHLSKIGLRVLQVPDIRKIEGVLVWAIREEIADVGEKEPLKEERDWEGNLVTVDFATALRQL
jgi:hypothetical protein